MSLDKCNFDISIADIQKLGRIHREQGKYPVILILGDTHMSQHFIMPELPSDYRVLLMDHLEGEAQLSQPGDIALHKLVNHFGDLDLPTLVDDKPKGKFNGPPPKHMSRRRQLKSSK